MQGLGQDTRARDGREGTRGGRGTGYFEKNGPGSTGAFELYLGSLIAI